MRIAVCGIGRAGKTMAHRILSEKDYELVAIINRDSSTTIGKDLGDLIETEKKNILVSGVSQLAQTVKDKKVDLIIDFSNKSTTLNMLREIVTNDLNVKMVICTTNFTDEERIEFDELCEKSKGGIVYAPNLTIGINLLIEFVRKLSLILKNFEFEIVERHRKDKARITTTARIIADAIDREDVNISSVRVGGYVGVHEVTAASENERITIEHESFSRDAFADGALLAASFLKGKDGNYNMVDVVNELERECLQ